MVDSENVMVVSCGVGESVEGVLIGRFGWADDSGEGTCHCFWLGSGGEW